MSRIFLPLISNGMNLVRSNFASSLLRGFTRREMVVCNIDYAYPDGGMNLVAAAFLKTDCEVMFIADGDLTFSRSDVDHLLEHETEPLVFGYYCKRKPGMEIAVETFDGNAPHQVGQFWEVKSAARGFSVWRREAFDIMRDDSPQFESLHTNSTERAYFRCKVGGHSEDFEFCERWRARGQRVLVDPRVFVTHMGDCGFPMASEREALKEQAA